MAIKQPSQNLNPHLSVSKIHALPIIPGPRLREAEVVLWAVLRVHFFMWLKSQRCCLLKTKVKTRGRGTVVSVIKFSKPQPHCGAQGCSPSSHLAPDTLRTQTSVNNWLPSGDGFNNLSVKILLISVFLLRDIYISKFPQHNIEKPHGICKISQIRLNEILLYLLFSISMEVT